MKRVLRSAIALATISLLITACAPLQSLSDAFPELKDPNGSRSVATSPDVKLTTTPVSSTQSLPSPKQSTSTPTQTQGANAPVVIAPLPIDASKGSGGFDVDQLKRDMNAGRVQADEDRLAGEQRREWSLRRRAEMDALEAKRTQDLGQSNQNACGSLLDTKNQAMAQLEATNPETMCASYKNNSSQNEYNACIDKVINGKKQGEANLTAFMKKFDYMNCK